MPPSEAAGASGTSTLSAVRVEGRGPSDTRNASGPERPRTWSGWSGGPHRVRRSVASTIELSRVKGRASHNTRMIQRLNGADTPSVCALSAATTNNCTWGVYPNYLSDLRHCRRRSLSLVAGTALDLTFNGRCCAHRSGAGPMRHHACWRRQRVRSRACGNSPQAAWRWTSTSFGVRPAAAATLDGDAFEATQRRTRAVAGRRPRHASGGPAGGHDRSGEPRHRAHG